jgi:hypothetical protein
MHMFMVTKAARPRIGDLLKEDGLLSDGGLERGLSAQRRTGREIRLGSALVGLGVITEEALLSALTRSHGCPSVGLAELSAADPAAVKLLSSARAYRLGAIPFALEKKSVRVAFLDPSNIAALDEVAAVTGKRVVPAVTSEVRLMEAHEKFYGRPLSRHFANILKRLDARPEETAPVILPTPPPPPRFVDDSVAESPEESAVAFVDESPAEPAGGSLRPDPFSDAYSLTDFLAEALDGVSIDALWEAAGGNDEETLDPGEPISDDDENESSEAIRRGSEKFESTQPSRRTRGSSDDPGSLGLGALA